MKGDVEMSKRIPVIIVGALLLVAAIWGLYRSWNNAERDALVIYGNVDIRQVDLGFRVTGRIREMRFEEGDKIKKGQIIGYCGSTGKSTAPHVHYEVLLNSVGVNPVKYLNKEIALK